MKYRIVQNQRTGYYAIQKKSWYFPFWIFEKEYYNMYEINDGVRTLEFYKYNDAIKWISKELNPPSSIKDDIWLPVHKEMNEEPIIGQLEYTNE